MLALLLSACGDDRPSPRTEATVAEPAAPSASEAVVPETGSSAAPAPQSIDAPAEAEPPAAEPPATPTDGADPEDAAELARQQAELDEIDAELAEMERERDDRYPIDPIPYPTGPITVRPREVTWTKLAEQPGPLRLRRIPAGVLGVRDDQAYGVGPDGTLVELDVEVPYASLSGRYPEDAWYVWLHPRDSSQESFQLRRWRSNGKWVAQSIDGEKTREDLSSVMLSKGWRAGFLVGEIDEIARQRGVWFYRVAPAGVPAPTEQPVIEGAPTAFMETRAGDVLLFIDIEHDGRSHTIVQRSCDDGAVFDCHRTSARALPSPEGHESTWLELQDVPRGRHGLTTRINESRRPLESGVPQGHGWLLHYDRGRWSLEGLPDDQLAKYLWPTEDGGLWIAVEVSGVEHLLHRDPKGTWSRPSLPEGLEGEREIQVALVDGTRVWLSGKAGAHHGLWQTSASLAEVAAEAPMATTPAPAPGPEAAPSPETAPNPGPRAPASPER